MVSKLCLHCPMRHDSGVARLTVSLQQERVKVTVRMVCAEPGPTGRAGPFQFLEEGLQDAGLPRLLTSLPLPSTWKMSFGCLHQ